MSIQLKHWPFLVKSCNSGGGAKMAWDNLLQPFKLYIYILNLRQFFKKNKTVLRRSAQKRRVLKRVVGKKQDYLKINSFCDINIAHFKSNFSTLWKNNNIFSHPFWTRAYSVQNDILLRHSETLPHFLIKDKNNFIVILKDSSEFRNRSIKKYFILILFFLFAYSLRFEDCRMIFIFWLKLNH